MRILPLVVSRSTCGFAADAAPAATPSDRTSSMSRRCTIDPPKKSVSVRVGNVAHHLELRRRGLVALVELDGALVVRGRETRVHIGQVLVRDRVVGRRLQRELELV